MRRTIALASILALLGSVGLVTAAGASGLWKAPPFASIGIKNVYFIGNEYVLGGAGGTIVRFYMETGSANEACLTSLGEANHAPAVEPAFCSSRYVTLADGHQHWGLMVTMRLAGPLEDDPSYEATDPSLVPAWYSLNVYQEGARFYGEPIRCDLDGC